MGDPSASRHPVHFAWSNELLDAEAVAVHELSFEQVGHRGYADMWVRRHIESPSWREFRALHMIAEDERANEPPPCSRPHPVYREPAEITDAWFDDEGDRPLPFLDKL
jgi:hypothetical protein